MERNERGTKVIAIIALCVAVVGLSIGFAAFTKDLNITFSDSNVNVSGDLDIKFLASEDPTDSSTTIVGAASLNYPDDVAKSATISSNGMTISGLGGTFYGKGQSIYYNFYIYNNSEYDAYLKSVDFLNYAGAAANKVCTAMEGTTQSLVDAACEDIHIGMWINDNWVFDTNTSDFKVSKIEKGKIVQVSIEIDYVDSEMAENLFGTTSDSILPNGDFKINFGDIKFSFSSLEG